MPSRSRRGGAAARTWARTAGLAALTALVLVPIAVIVVRAFAGVDPRSGAVGFSLAGILGVFRFGAGQWIANSLAVSAATVLAALAIGAPAGYALSRARGRWVSGYGLAVFVIQSLPAIVFVVPLFLVFARIGLIDSLVGLTIVYVGSTLAAATWMMAAAIDAVPIAIEEAAWLDGCSIAGGFVRIVLRNSGAGLLSAAILVFLQAWNEYLIAVVFLKSDANRTLAIALAGSHSPALAVVMMLPPVLIFAVLHRFVRIGVVARPSAR